MVLASEPVGGRSRATELPCLYFIFETFLGLRLEKCLRQRNYIRDLMFCDLKCNLYEIPMRCHMIILKWEESLSR